MNSRKQMTIAEHVEIEGPGLFSGRNCKMRFCPAPEDTGIVFVRTDSLSPVEVPVTPEFIAERPRRTSSIARDKVYVDTVEHVLAAIWGLGIDNLRIEMDAEETVSLDGSALPFIRVLENAGLEEQDFDREDYVITEPIFISDGNQSIAALPGHPDRLELVYELEYEAPSIGRQLYGFDFARDNFVTQLAPARTFLLEREAEEFRSMGLGTHLGYGDVLVMADAGPIENELRFKDEHVRHKMLDLVGDLALLGRKIAGKVIATRSGHELNHKLVKQLLEAIGKESKSTNSEPVMDIRKIMKRLPHRYPFLMIDRIISIDEKKAVGLKNVTINEPYFTGHYPHLPLMPGVMMVEAMAQLSGILFSSRMEHTGKTAVLLSMDKVKLRKPVQPGDQLVLESEAIRARARTGHSKCIARVGGQVVAEAEIKFMLVDSETT